MELGNVDIAALFLKVNTNYMIIIINVTKKKWNFMYLGTKV